MSDCERHQETLSAFLDGETSPAEALPALDHLLRCAACRGFYGKARALQQQLAASARAESAAPPAVWERIVADAAGAPARRGSMALLRSWAPRLAAAFVLGLAAWSGYALGGGAGPGMLGLAGEATASQVEIEVGAGGMTDSRFLDLTLEILRADRRYHDKLLEVLTAVDAGERAGGARRESDAVLSSEDDRPRREQREPGFTTANL
jgi:hypothetical protein